MHNLKAFVKIQRKNCSYDFFIVQSKLFRHATIFDNSPSQVVVRFLITGKKQYGRKDQIFLKSFDSHRISHMHLFI